MRSSACAEISRAPVTTLRTYFGNSHVMKLHFEHLHCDRQARFCRGASCLHQEYISTLGHYRLMKSYYDRNND
jgi:hypothetical protein